MTRSLYARLLPFFSIALLAAIAYGNSINNGYVWDDRYFLTDYAWINTLQDALKVSFEPLFGQRAYVRPLPLLTLYVEAIATSRNPAISHAINLILHIACSLLVYLIAHRATGHSTKKNSTPSDWLPLLLACMFTVHPALSEAVIWISSRFDLLATLFMLCAIWIAGTNLNDWPRALTVGALFFAGALSKESTAMLPAVLGAYALLNGAAKRGSNRIMLRDAFTLREWKMYAAILAFGIIYLIIRFQVLEGSKLLQNQDPGTHEHIARIGLSLYKYTQLTLIPFVGNAPHHSFSWLPTDTVTTYWPQLLISTILLILTATLAIRKHIAGWWLLAWLAGYLPVMHIVPLSIGANIVHQRFMYFPTAVLLAFSPYVFSNLQLTATARKLAITLTILFIAISAFVSFTIVPVWRNDLALWQWTVAMDPKSVEARENLIWTYIDNNMMDKANEQLAYIEINNILTTPNVAVNMGVGHYRRGEFDMALHYYNIAHPKRKALSEIQQSRLLSNMAMAYAVVGKSHESQLAIMEALKLDRTNTVALGNLMAFCDGKPIDPRAYRQIDVERAAGYARKTTHVLNEYQSKAQAARNFCPSINIEKEKI